MKKICLFAMAALFSTYGWADNKQTVTINGQSVNKTVTEITFNGDNLTLTYSDGTSEESDMSFVKLAFSYDTNSTGINQVETVKQSLHGKVFNLNGQFIGTSTEGLAKGIYIVNGKKVIIK